MEQFEKVRKGFECCYMDKTPKHCEGCPYNIDDEGCGHDAFALERDALSLIGQQQERIKELEAGQTARVMTLEDAAKSDVCWLEVRDMDRVMPCRIRWYYNSYFIKLFEGAPERFTENEYGTGLRFWTQRPTDEQRKAVPWNERSSI